jgi:tRNA dimethylallyltransferase
MSGPLVTVFGTTGVGKSQLAVELARHLAQSPTAGWTGARVINADAMQTYEGMDIITNKMPLHERQGVDHRLMSFKKPGEQYVVGQWVEDAIKEVQSISPECNTSVLIPFID